MAELKKVVFELPDEHTPGYLRRMKNLAEFQKAQKNAKDEVERFEKMCAFLSGYIVEPTDPEEAKEALMDATKEQIDDLFALIGGKREIVPPSSGESLETTTR
jgi:hypothetical protein